MTEFSKASLVLLSAPEGVELSAVRACFACTLAQVCVAALCIKQKDLLHAGYLAITLLFFRQRYWLMTAAQPGQRSRGARLFAWLPAFNLVVMTLTLLYQVTHVLTATVQTLQCALVMCCTFGAAQLYP